LKFQLCLYVEQLNIYTSAVHLSDNIAGILGFSGIAGKTFFTGA